MDAQKAKVDTGRISDKVVVAQQERKVHMISVQSAQSKLERVSAWRQGITAQAKAADSEMGLQSQHMEANHRILNQRQAELALLLSMPGAKRGGSPQIRLAEEKLKSQKRRIER